MFHRSFPAFPALSAGVSAVLCLMTCSATLAQPASTSENAASTSASTRAVPVPAELRRWLAPQNWKRDIDHPVLSLGTAGEFDDTHMFAPCVARFDGRYHLWYCGSRGTVARRVFHMGLATGTDGREFVRHAPAPVFRFGDGRHSILTPTLLRETTGEPVRENGRMRMWFSSTWFFGGEGKHTLHETTSADGVDWAEPSKPLLEDVYAPTILKVGQQYHMWYSDVSVDPWIVRHASSPDGRRWKVTPKPVLEIDQRWERTRMFYPCVIRDDGVFLMWYGCYWSAETAKTALGFAVSTDGIHWHKHPENPVLRPDPSRPWESHYNTSQSVIRLADGRYRMWYASRKAPPHVNKYFAIGTAVWNGPQPAPAE